jgi:hypothetical protein
VTSTGEKLAQHQAMGAWDERQHTLLRRKLQALNYNDHLDIGSCELVRNLVNDLIRTTESYRDLRQHGDKQQQEIAAFRSKVPQRIYYLLSLLMTRMFLL